MVSPRSQMEKLFAREYSFIIQVLMNIFNRYTAVSPICANADDFQTSPVISYCTSPRCFSQTALTDDSPTPSRAASASSVLRDRYIPSFPLSHHSPSKLLTTTMDSLSPATRARARTNPFPCFMRRQPSTAFSRRLPMMTHRSIAGTRPVRHHGQS